MSEYKLQTTDGVIRVSDGALIPFADGNSDYEKYLKWLDDGNTPDPALDAAELDAIRISDIKAEANRRIIEILPEYKQRNLLARMVELLDKETLTAEEQTEKDAAKAVWATIQGIRTTSNTAETDGTALADINW